MDSGFYESKDGNYLYTVNGNDCSLRRVNKYSSEFIIPETIDEKSVRVVSATVFQAGKDIIERVVFPNSVKYLEYKSFIDMKMLKSVVLSGGISIVPMYSFVHCDALEEIIIPKGISSVQSLATQECMSLKRIMIYEDNLILTDGSFSDIVNSITSNSAYEYPRYKLDGTPDYRYNLVKKDTGIAVYGEVRKGLTLFVHPGSATEKIAKQYGYNTEVLE